MADLAARVRRALNASLGSSADAQAVIDILNSIDVLSGQNLTADIDELNKLDGATVTTAEINTLDLSAVGAIVKVKKLSISSTPDGTEEDTGWDLPAKCMILPNIYVDVTTAESTGTDKTMDVGTLSSDSGDADGFLDGVSCASTGLVKGTLASGGQTLGALLRVDESGGGVLVPEPCIAPGSVSVTYTAKDTDWAEFRGAIYIPYIEIG